MRIAYQINSFKVGFNLLTPKYNLWNSDNPVALENGNTNSSIVCIR